MRAMLPGLLTLAMLFIGTFSSVQAETWPQWRGLNRDGKCTQDWPSTLSEDRLRLSYRVKLGPSYSGPIVAEDRVFVTESRDEKDEVVKALARDNGRVLWESNWQGAMKVPFFARANGSWIRSTPALDGDSLYVAGMKDVLVCLDTNDGAQKWKVDFTEACGTPAPSFGFVCSPLVLGDHIIVQAGASVAKLNKVDGSIVWRALNDGGGMMSSAFSSPVYVTLAGKEQLLVQTRTELAGIDLESGDVLWTQDVPAFRGMNILTPTVHGDGVFTSTYGGKSFLFSIAPSDDGDGDAFEVSERWANKVQGYMSSPVIIDGHAYLHLRNQRFACIDLETGKEKWISKPFGKYWSLVANGNQILALDEIGEFLLIDATPDEFRLADRRKVSDDSTWAHLAVVDGQVFVRELGGLAVYELSLIHI